VPQAPADVVVTRRGEVAQVTATPTPEDSPTPEPTQTPVPTAEPTATPNPTPTVQPTAPPEPTATPEPQAEVKQIGQIVWDDIGQTFTIKQATITDAWGTSGGANYRLSDGTGTIILFVFQDDYEEMSLDLRYDLVQGTVLDVTGEIGEWRGDLEIIPRERADLKLRTVGEHPPLEERKIIDITPSDVGRWFRVEATIQAVQTSSSYVKLVVGDGTGQIVVLLWQNIYERVPDREQLNTGALIRVVGEFSIYEKGGNEFQIVPLAGADVEVLP
jgi:DNA/RNA endonuclease YhcR with UshA esterase domain